MAIRDSSNENSTNGSNTSKVGQSIMGSKKTVAKTEELYSDKNIKSPIVKWSATQKTCSSDILELRKTV